jgi:hypothetical protein
MDIPRRYTTSGAFRRVLEERLKRISQAEEADISRLRRQVSFDRLLAKLFRVEPVPWALKGGYALELRFKTARSICSSWPPHLALSLAWAPCVSTSVAGLTSSEPLLMLCSRLPQEWAAKQYVYLSCKRWSLSCWRLKKQELAHDGADSKATSPSANGKRACGCSSAARLNVPAPKVER